MKLFSKSFGRRHLFEKRRHPKTFITCPQQITPNQRQDKHRRSRVVTPHKMTDHFRKADIARMAPSRRADGKVQHIGRLIL
ncbi:hypothetical protein C3920_04310 [Novacetimonas pomaceti]|uniref:Uncharacterized protein n=1 Tax=Novacetimonas pomaceti TaxID=2021998 RepID=A0ABX5P425_9PROT|nr:hypothetical protein C3920_04310 [Novacetimonas pomaceti]